MDPLIADKLLGVQYIDPDAGDYRTYFHAITAYNREVQKKVAAQFEQELVEYKDSCNIATVGSDARLEKGPVSKIELLVLHTNPTRAEEVKKKLNDFVTTDNGSKLFDEDVELKHLFQDPMYLATSYAGTDHQSQWLSPHRIFDCQTLFGKEEYVLLAKEKLVTEIRGNPKIYEESAQKARQQSKLAETGHETYKQLDIVHFDVLSCTANYDPERYHHSVKRGLLRAVQFALIRDAVRAIRDGADPEPLLALSQNTVGKISELQAQGRLLLSTEDAMALLDNYQFFLREYHRSQHAYRTERVITTGLDLSPVEFKERCDFVSRVCRKKLFE